MLLAEAVGLVVGVHGLAQGDGVGGDLEAGLVVLVVGQVRQGFVQEGLDVALGRRD